MAKTGKHQPATEDHPLRRFVLDEIHARPLAPISTPRRVLHLACSTEEGSADAGRDALAAFANRRGGVAPSAEARHHTLTLPEGRLRWERHTEFAAYSWDMDLPGRPEWASAPFMLPQDAPPLPGPRVVATELLLIKGKTAPWQDSDTVTWEFDGPSLCLSDVEHGKATVVTDFRLWPDGLTRILVIDHGLSNQNAGALVQRLIEIETYRAFALMALPVVLKSAPALAEMEENLVSLLGASGQPDGGSHRALLDQLNDLAIGLERQLAATSYRISASKAYEEILADRLEAMGETVHHGYRTWSAFLNRRLGPALRTCASLGTRQDRLSQRLVRAAALLRTRVDIALEDQNNAVLRAMNRRSQLQLRLQHTVEGLSIAAVSYYIVGLVSYLAKGGQVLGLPVPPAVIAALSVPLVIVWVAWLVRRIRKRSLHDTAE